MPVIIRFDKAPGNVYIIGNGSTRDWNFTEDIWLKIQAEK